MTVPFVMFSSYSTPFEFQHTFKLAGPTRLFVSPTLLSLALTSGLTEDRIYILEGNVHGRTSYADLVARARSNRLPRLPIRQARSDALAYLAFSSGTSGLPKGTLFPAHLNIKLPLLELSLACANSHRSFVSRHDFARKPHRFSLSGINIGHGGTQSPTRMYFLFLKHFDCLSPVLQKPPVWNGPGGLNVIFNVLPMHHVYGLHIATFRCFLSPATVVLLPKWNADVYFDSLPK